MPSSLLARALSASALVLIPVLALGACSSAPTTDSGSAGTASSAAADDALAALRKSGVLKIGTEGTYAPFTYHDTETNELTGYDIEIVRAIDERLPQYEVEFQTTDFQGIFPGLDSGRYDIVANNLSVTAEREEKYRFTRPHITAQFGAVVRTDGGIGEVTSLDELAGLTTYGQPGLNFTKVLEAHNEANPEQAVRIEYTELDLQSQFNNLLAGRVDFLFVERVPFECYGKGDPGLAFRELPGEYLESSFGTNLDSALAFSPQSNDVDRVVADFDAALEELKADGTLAALSEEFFGADLTPKE